MAIRASGSRGLPTAVLLVLFSLLICVAPAAQAHTRSESHSVWEIDGPHVDVVITIPAVEAARLTADGSPPSNDVMARYLAAHVYPATRVARCALTPPIEPLAAAAGFRKFDATFVCPTGQNVDMVFSAFFDVVPSHLHFAQIQNVATGQFTDQLITADRQRVQLTGGNRLQTAGFLEFVGMGIMHIFTGVDHMSFLLGLVLISRRFRDLIFVVTGFTIGHSLTLALAVTGVIRPHAEYIDALVALTIALIGAENVVVANGRPWPVALAAGLGLGAMALGRLLGWGGLPPLLLLGAGLFTANYLMISGRMRDAGRLRILVTLVFGLIHGFGFAAGLLELQIPPKRLAELLVGFNVGVEIGQLSLVLGVTALVLVLARLRLSLPRRLMVDTSAAFLIGLGIFWFITRSYA